MRRTFLVLLAGLSFFSGLAAPNQASASVEEISNACSARQCMKISWPTTEFHAGESYTLRATDIACPPYTELSRGVFGSLFIYDGSTVTVFGDYVSLTADVIFPREGSYRVSLVAQCVATSSRGVDGYLISNKYYVEVGPPLVKISNLQVSVTDTTATIGWTANIFTNGQYVVTASPSGARCSVSDTFGCTISGLPSGSSQTFVVSYSDSTGQSTSTGAYGPVVIQSPLQASLAVSGSMKVGSTLTMVPMVVGTVGHTDYQWFRCDVAVASGAAQPPCTMIAGQSGSTYQLTSQDLGKFVTPFIHLTNQVSDVMFTAGSSMAVVGETAPPPVPVADPGGLPGITDISNREVPINGGATITVTGTNLSNVTSVKVNGVEAEVISRADNSITFRVPASSGKSGLVDLVVTNSKGSAVSNSALNYVNAPSATYPTKTLKVSPFSPSAKTLTLAQKAAIKKFVISSNDYTRLKCVGDVTGLSKSATQSSLALLRAKAACAYAKSIKPKLVTSSSGGQSKFSGAIVRLVNLTLTH